MAMTASGQLRGLLGDPVYLRVWLCGVCSGVARWLEVLVFGVFAFETTGSPFLVALLVILRMLPLAVFGSIVGTFGDRTSPRLFLCVGFSLAAIASAAMFLLFSFGIARYWHVALVSFASGAVWTADMALRRRLMGDIAGQVRVVPAMSLESASSNATRMLGPLLGGLLYQWLGVSGAFALGAGLYAMCVIMIMGIPAAVASGAAAGRAAKALRDLQEVLRFVVRDRDILRILLVTVVFNIWGFPFVSMIPVIGSDELGLSAGWIGGLAALEGGGGFLGSLLIAVGARAMRFRRLYYFGTMAWLLLVFVAGWLVDAFSMAAVLFCVGLAGACFTTMQSTLIYSTAPPHLRGRLFGVLVICIGTGLVGFANVGLMGEWFGGSAAIRIIALEGLVPLVIIGFGWRQLWASADAGSR